MSKRKNKILPTALATTLAFGAAPFAVSAEVDFEAIGETYPATADWTEEDWNTYLGENYGTDLAAYETNEELYEDLGEPIDMNAWISNQEDANVLDAMERYGITGDELAAILQENDNLENIHFVGDLENVLEEEGFTDTTATEEEVVDEEVVDEETAIDDEVADAEIYDDDVVESEEEGEIGEDGEEAAAAGEEAFDYGEVDQAMLEDTYLTPLGWTAEEFDSYLMEQYDMGIADFESFDVLETTVGPFIDVNELITDVEDGTVDDAGVVGLMEEYGLDAAETEEFLNGIEEPDAINFYADLEDEIVAAGFTDLNGEDDETPVEEDGEASEGAEVDLGAIAMEDIESVYLEPLGDWTVMNFNDYLMETFDMGIADFTDFNELQDTVGPVITVSELMDDVADGTIDEERLADLATEYGLDAVEFEEFLTGIEDSAREVNFYADVESELIAAGYDSSDEEVVDGGEEMEGLDMTMVEETYLTPFGWTEEDFNTYLMDNYDMELTDFNDFAELEDTVGPLLDDETLSATLYEYDLTEDEYNTFLEDNGFTEDDFVFVADLEWALEDAGFTVVNEVNGEEMPDTATNAVQNALIGTGIALLGAAAFFVSRRREGEQ